MFPANINPFSNPKKAPNMPCQSLYTLNTVSQARLHRIANLGRNIKEAAARICHRQSSRMQLRPAVKTVAFTQRGTSLCVWCDSLRRKERKHRLPVVFLAATQVKRLQLSWRGMTDGPLEEQMPSMTTFIFFQYH